MWPFFNSADLKEEGAAERAEMDAAMVAQEQLRAAAHLKMKELSKLSCEEFVNFYERWLFEPSLVPGSDRFASVHNFMNARMETFYKLALTRRWRAEMATTKSTV